MRRRVSGPEPGVVAEGEGDGGLADAGAFGYFVHRRR